MKRNTDFKHIIPELNNQILNAEKNGDTKFFNQKRLDNEITKSVNCLDLLKARIEESKKERESLALQVLEKEKGNFFLFNFYEGTLRFFFVREINFFEIIYFLNAKKNLF